MPNLSIELTVLGCGTSTGVPLISCDCTVCRSKNKKNQRLRASVWFKIANKKQRLSFLVDTSTDLRQQALRHNIQRIDCVLWTHPHADHVGGVDELRSFNFIQKAPIPGYGNQWTCQELRTRFSYIFNASPQEGGGIPRIDLSEIPDNSGPLDIQGVTVMPVPAQHGSKTVLGYRIESVAYMTDCSYIPPSSLDRLRDLKVLVLDCLRVSPHPTHLNLEKALEIIAKVKPRKTYLTHMGHDFDYSKWNKRLPKGVELAYDGLKIKTKP